MQDIGLYCHISLANSTQPVLSCCVGALSGPVPICHSEVDSLKALNDSIKKNTTDVELIACPSCDYLADISGLNHGERASCLRCGHLLTVFQADGISRVLSYTVSALILLLLANCYPFLSFKAAGLDSVVTLPRTVLALYLDGMPMLALLVAGFIILLPFLWMLLVLLLFIPLYFQRSTSWLVAVGRLIFTLQNWCMVEVFLIGVIVSLVKISAMADVVLGISFWAYSGFSICFTLSLTNLDRLECWHAIERLNPA